MILIKDPIELVDMGYYFITGIDGIVKLAQYFDENGLFTVGACIEEFEFEELETIMYTGV